MSKGNFCPDFRQIRGGQRNLPTSVGSWLPLAQNNSNAKVAYFGMAHSDLLQEVNTSNSKHWLASIGRAGFVGKQGLELGLMIEWIWLPSNKTLLVGTEITISCSFHMT